MVAGEAYYRPGPLLFGSEFFVQRVDAPQSGNPWFHGGDVVVSWLATGERRAYNSRGGFFKQISPAKAVFEGGPGAWELVGRFESPRPRRTAPIAVGRTIERASAVEQAGQLVHGSVTPVLQ
jgi:phosphate-selective porin